eukprot:1170734-Pyramimonas_sp.AAC.2
MLVLLLLLFILILCIILLPTPSSIHPASFSPSSLLRMVRLSPSSIPHFPDHLKTRLSVDRGWAGGDTRSVKNLEFKASAR